LSLSDPLFQEVSEIKLKFIERSNLRRTK